MLKKMSIVVAAIAGLAYLPQSTKAATFNLTVNGTDAIFLAGRTDLSIPPASDPWTVLRRHSGPTPEELPETLPSFVTVASGDTVNFSALTGGVDYFNGIGNNFFSPSGNTLGTSNLNPLDGISGYRGPQGPLVGVFLNDAIPNSSTAPSTLDFTTSGLGINFASVAPQLAQVFYIGDGLTNTGQVQNFVAPSGATRLFLGIPDGFGFIGNPGAYDDNDGSFHARIDVITPAAESVPEPTSFIGILLIGGLTTRILARKKAF